MANKQKQKGRYTGVYFNFVSQKWQIEICIDSKKKVIGYHKNESVAALLRDRYIIQNDLPNKLQVLAKRKIM
jgi:hypothetical protein